MSLKTKQRTFLCRFENGEKKTVKFSNHVIWLVSLWENANFKFLKHLYCSLKKKNSVITFHITQFLLLLF